MDKNNFTCPHCNRQLTVSIISTKFSKGQLEQSTSIPSMSVSRSRRRGFWDSDFSKGLLVLGGIPVVGGIIAQIGEYDPFLGAFFGTLGSAIAGSGLLILKWHFEKPQPAKKPKQQGANIKVKFTEYGDGKRYLLDELKLDGVDLEDFEKVAKAVMIDGKNFSRPALRKIISQSKWHAIKDAFVGLQYAVNKPTGQNGYVLTLRGKALLRKIASLP